MTHRIEFLVFSDIHFHDHNKYATDTGKIILTNNHGIESINTRLIDCVNVFKQVIDYAHENRITRILFGGDLLHSKKNVSKDVINAVMAAFSYADCHGVHLYMIPGNHDYVDKQGTNHSLLAVTNFSNVCIASPKMYLDFNGTTALNAVPYTEDKEALLKKINDNATSGIFSILLAHCGIQGASVGSDYVMVKDHDVDVGSIDYSKYDICLFGHYHEHQKVFPNGWIIGATHEHVWSDIGGKRGFLHVILEKENPKDKTQITLKHIPTDRSIPRFKKISMDSDWSDVKPWDFIKFETAEEITDDVRDNITGYLSVVTKGIPKWLEIIPSPKQAEETEEFQISSKATSPESVLDEWIDYSKTELPRDKLLKVGQELLSQVKRDNL